MKKETILFHIPWIMICCTLVAAVFCVGALDRHPYGYYQLLRWIVCGVCAYVTFVAGRMGIKWAALGFGIVALIFNPVIPFHLSRDTWRTIDLLAAVWCVAAGVAAAVQIGIRRSNETTKKEKYLGSTGGEQLSAGLDPRDLKDVSVIAGAHLERIIRLGIEQSKRFGEWSKQMAEDLGDWIKPHLRKMWDHPDLKALRDKAEGEPPPLPTGNTGQPEPGGKVASEAGGSMDEKMPLSERINGRYRNMNIMQYGNKTLVAVSFVAGALLVAAIAYFLLRPSLPSVQALQCDVQPNEFIGISGFEIKVLDTDKKLPKNRRDNSPQPRMASLQWRCNVKNISTIPVRYDLKAELLDRDGFVLATDTVDSNYGQGDLSPGQPHTVHKEIDMEYLRASTIKSSRVTAKALKTNQAVQAERQNVQAERQRQIDAVQAEQQRQIDAVRNAWKELRQGMTKSDVQALLGKPHSINYLGWWEYTRIKGTYSTPRVEFTANGLVEGWQAPGE